MSPQDAAYLRMPVDDGEELVRIVQCHGIQPAAAHRDRLVVHAHQGVRVGRTGQQTVEFLQAFRGEVRALAAGDGGVEKNEMPATVVQVCFEPAQPAVSQPAQQLPLVVIAGQAVDRQPQLAEIGKDACIGGRRRRVGQIAGSQYQVRRQVPVRHVGNDRLQRLLRVQAKQAPVGIVKQVGIGNLQYLDGPCGCCFATDRFPPAGL